MVMHGALGFLQPELHEIASPTAIDVDRRARTLFNVPVVSEPGLDQWGGALDGTVVESGGDAWRIVLDSVRMIDDRQWLQLVLVGEPTFTITLGLPWTADADYVRLVLADWLAETDDHTDSVVSVGRIELPYCDIPPACFVPVSARSSQIH
jgi:hypothetical protein